MTAIHLADMQTAY